MVFGCPWAELVYGCAHPSCPWWPGHHAEGIAKTVMHAYGEIAVAKLAHSEHLRSFMPPAVIEQELRSEAALTTALLGLIAEEALIGPRMGQFGRRRAEPPAAGF